MTPPTHELPSFNQSQPFYKTTQPNLTRIFDYLSGGVTHFDVDRKVADQLVAKFPQIRMWVRLGKAFTQEAVNTLYKDGFDQFLDLGSSLPSESSFHIFAPQANVIYTDINPVAVGYGNSLFANLERVEYIQGNALKIGEILENRAVKRLIDARQKVAIGLNYLVLYLTPEEIKTLTQKLFDWAPTGSQIFSILYLKKATGNHAEYNTFQKIINKFGPNLGLYTLDECLEMLGDWKPRNLNMTRTFIGLPDDKNFPNLESQIDLEIMAAFFEKV